MSHSIFRGSGGARTSLRPPTDQVTYKEKDRVKKLGPVLIEAVGRGRFVRSNTAPAVNRAVGDRSRHRRLRSVRIRIRPMSEIIVQPGVGIASLYRAASGSVVSRGC